MRPPCTVQSPTQNRLRPAVDTPDVEQTFSERETSVAISPSKSQGPKVAAFTLSVPLGFSARNVDVGSLPRAVDLDKAGNFGPGPSESISTLRSSAERWARRMREHQAKRPERAHQQNRLSRSGNQQFIAIFSTLPRARVVRLRQHG